MALKNEKEERDWNRYLRLRSEVASMSFNHKLFPDKCKEVCRLEENNTGFAGKYLNLYHKD